MGIFGHKDTSPPAPQTRGRDVSPVRDNSPRRGGSIFSRRRSVSPLDNNGPQRSSSSLNRNGTNNTANSRSSFGGGGSGFFHRHNGEDQSITAARQRVIDAEGAERGADKALIAARTAVKEARDQVRLLEEEAKEEARLAKLKAKAAGDISKRAKPLGRHDRF